jgi:hypothetical protein
MISCCHTATLRREHLQDFVDCYVLGRKPRTARVEDLTAALPGFEATALTLEEGRA